jgi:hypothetical protein
MTQEPEYIINGTKVEVGQVWESKEKNRVVVDRFKHGNTYPIRASNHSFTKKGKYREHSIDDEFDIIKCVGVVAPLPEPITYQGENGWVAWHGGECPVHPEKVVDFITRNESYEDFVSEKAVNLRWIYLDDPSDIIAYRIVTPHAEQPVTPRKLMLSEWEMVQAHIMLMTKDDRADYTVEYLIKNVIEGNPELMERIK